ncbi:MULTISPECIES: hypothetical protein [unclassified Phenylobacterium]|uniref:hypothetical protein n=1 Tax=unclassified Phenylobacterium TaxID=2640670 RepID=UPI00083A3927|nr:MULTISPECIES: hypothetical protein [unclassified Phenylobacterium]
MSARYRFLVHRRHPAFRLVVRADRPFPPAAIEADWRDTRIRDEADVNDQVRQDVMRDGYSLFRIGLSLADLPAD